MVSFVQKQNDNTGHSMHPATRNSSDTFTVAGKNYYLDNLSMFYYNGFS